MILAQYGLSIANAGLSITSLTWPSGSITCTHRTPFVIHVDFLIFTSTMLSTGITAESMPNVDLCMPPNSMVTVSPSNLIREQYPFASTTSDMTILLL